MGNFTFQIWKTFNVQAGICFHYVNSRSCLLLGWWAAQAAFPWRLACLVKGAAGNWLAAKACTMYHSTVCVARKQQKRQSVFNKMDKIWHYTETAGLSNSPQKFTECKRENKIFVCEDQESRHRCCPTTSGLKNVYSCSRDGGDMRYRLKISLGRKSKFFTRLFAWSSRNSCVRNEQ